MTNMRPNEAGSEGAKDLNFIDAVRTLRKERDMSFESAKIAVIQHFKDKGIPLPSVFSK